jgi:hypothetical protein
MFLHYTSNVKNANITGPKTVSKFKYTSMMHKEMQKMGILMFFIVYSLKHAVIKKLFWLKTELPKINKSGRFYSSSYTFCALITKDQGN